MSLPGYVSVPVKDNEAVYDEQIHPLMAQVIAICKEHGLPFIASFVYAPDNFCTTSIPGPDDDTASQKLVECYRILRPPSPPVFAFTIMTTKAVTP